MTIFFKPLLIASCSVALLYATELLGQSFDSSAAAGHYSPTDLCNHNGSDSQVPVTCIGNWELNNYQSSGSAVSEAISEYGVLGISGTATCVSTLNPPLCSSIASGSAEFTDVLTFQNLPNVQTYLNVTSSAGVYTPNGKSVGDVSEVVIVSMDGSWFQCGTGILQGVGGACSEVVAVDPNTSANILVQLQGQAIVSSAGSASFDAGTGKTPYPTGGRIIALFLQDANGKRINGATIVAASGYKYPSTYATSTTLTSNPNPSMKGQTVIFTATPASRWPVPQGTVPTGTVMFRDGPSILGSAKLNNGVAEFSTFGLSIGSHRITATYKGDSFFGGSTSLVVIQTVN
jgi:hypothetical protein